jgi:hypothetical protein
MHTGFWWANCGKEPLETPRYGCEDNNKMDIKETGWNGVVWTEFISLSTEANCGLPCIL